MGKSLFSNQLLEKGGDAEEVEIEEVSCGEMHGDYRERLVHSELPLI